MKTKSLDTPAIFTHPSLAFNLMTRRDLTRMIHAPSTCANKQVVLQWQPCQCWKTMKATCSLRADRGGCKPPGHPGFLASRGVRPRVPKAPPYHHTGPADVTWPGRRVRSVPCPGLPRLKYDGEVWKGKRFIRSAIGRFEQESDS